MKTKSEKLTRLQMDNETAVGAVEALLNWARIEDEDKFRELAISLADCIIRACLVRK